MNLLAAWVIETFIVTTLLATIVWTACLAFKKYPAVQHALWLVVILRFVLPPVFQSPWSTDTNLTWLSVTTPIKIQLEEFQPNLFAHDHETISNQSQSTSLVLVTPRPLAVGAVLFWTTIVGWAIGTVLVLTVQARRIAKIRQLLRGPLPVSHALVDCVSRLSKIIGIRSVRVAVVGRIGTPFVWCWGRTVLVWPDFLSTETGIRQSRSIVAHELAHIRRRDHWVTWLDLIAGAIWWWNPVYRFVRRKLHESAEMSCDAIALSVLPEERLAYAEMFLQLSSDSKTGMPAPVLGMSTGTPSSFERRLSMILSDSVSCKLLKRGFLLAGILALTALPTWSLGQSKADKGRVVFKVVDSDSGSVVFEILEEPSGELKILELNDKSRDPLVHKLKALLEREEEATVRLDQTRKTQVQQQLLQQQVRQQIQQQVQQQIQQQVQQAQEQVRLDPKIQAEGSEMQSAYDKRGISAEARQALDQESQRQSLLEQTKRKLFQKQVDIQSRSEDLAKAIAEAVSKAELAKQSGNDVVSKLAAEARSIVSGKEKLSSFSKEDLERLTLGDLKVRLERDAKVAVKEKIAKDTKRDTKERTAKEAIDVEINVDSKVKPSRDTSNNDLNSDEKSDFKFRTIEDSVRVKSQELEKLKQRLLELERSLQAAQ